MSAYYFVGEDAYRFFVSGISGGFMKKVFVLLLLVLVGCATPVPPPKLEEIKSPELGTTSSAELGDTMVRYLVAARLPSWQLTQTFESILFEKNIPAGTTLTPWAESEEYESYREGLCRFKGSGNWYVGPNIYGACGYEAAFFSANGANISVKKANWIDVSTRNIDQQLIYNGKVGNYVKFTYREFTSLGIARDAFTQDVQYDLSEGTTIGFKGARIEIVEATNRKIRYRVIKHFPSQ